MKKNNLKKKHMNQLKVLKIRLLMTDFYVIEGIQRASKWTDKGSFLSYYLFQFDLDIDVLYIRSWKDYIERLNGKKLWGG